MSGKNTNNIVLFEDLNLVDGKNYLLKYGRTIIQYLSVDGEWFYVIINKKEHAMITFKDLPGSMRINSPKGGIGVKITCIDDGNVIFDKTKA